jgi:hypothetical protein
MPDRFQTLRSKSTCGATAWVSRIAADQRPSHRYKHMATVARLGTRYVVAWQASAVYEGHSDQRVYHTFSRDSAAGAYTRPLLSST